MKVKTTEMSVVNDTGIYTYARCRTEGDMIYIRSDVTADEIAIRMDAVPLLVKVVMAMWGTWVDEGGS